MKLGSLLVFVATSALAAPDAKSFIKAQLSSDADIVRPTFAPNALVILPAIFSTGALPVDQLEGFLRADDASFNDSKLGKLTSGTRGDATWIVADIVQPWQIIVDCPVGAARCERSRTLRLSELVVNGKAVVAHFDDPVDKRTMEPPQSPPMATTDAGPLSALLADPKALAAALLDDPAVAVIGTERAETAVGPAAAKKLLGSWSKLSLSLVGKPREVRTKTWGYAAGTVVWKTTSGIVNMRATVFAVDAGGAWKVVAAHYSRPYRRLLY